MENQKVKGFLLGWNPNNKERHWDYEKVYSEIQNGEKPTVGWTIKERKELKVGMEVFVIKLGTVPKGIIAHGYIIEIPSKHKIKIKFDSIQNANDEKEIISLAELTNKFKPKVWDSQGTSNSYINETILPELKEMWSKLINREENSKTSNGGRAVEICKNESEEDLIDYSEIMKKYNELKESNRIEFITFHQSYGYEEFIEGIKPIVLNEDDEPEDESENNQESKTNIKIENDIKYKIADGIFKKFCDNAKKAIIESKSNIYISPKAIVWKVTVKDKVKEDCFSNNHVRINFKLGTAGASKFDNEIKKGDIIITTDGSRTKINGIAVVTDGKAYTLDKEKSDTTTRNVSWLAKGINEDIYEINDKKILPRKTVTKVPNMKVEDIIKLAKEKELIALSKKEPEELSKIVIKENTKPYVFIIDEINRGNISKIFGELITLIETTKRAGKDECISTKLPYSKKEFTVPDNVYIIGTMNTADRSIALMDTALRRRFKFEEMLPDYDLLKDIFVEDEEVRVNIGAMLKVINERNNNIDKLENIFKKSVIPLLQEYFYEDYDKIRIVLGDNAKDEDEQFISAVSILEDVFEGNIDDIDIPEKKYIINYDNFKNIMAYKNISQKKDLSKKISDE